MYGSAPWKAFWEVRNKYKSGPPFSNAPSGAASAASRNCVPVCGGAYAPKRYASSGPARPAPIGAHQTPLEKGDAAVRKALTDRGCGVGRGEKWAELDPEGTGVATADAVRAWMAGLNAHGLGQEEADAVMASLDPHKDGTVLCRALSARFDPPQPDLAKLHEARRSQGVYDRLRGRAAAAPQPAVKPAPAGAWGYAGNLENVPPAVRAAEEDAFWQMAPYGGWQQTQLAPPLSNYVPPRVPQQAGQLGGFYRETVEQLQLLANLRSRAAD